MPWSRLQTRSHPGVGPGHLVTVIGLYGMAILTAANTHFGKEMALVMQTMHAQR